MVNRAPQGVGALLREWRQRRRMTQLELALEADVSPRHLSFVETGRAQPSRKLLLNLSNHLDIPLRERNALLVAAGYAPMYRERGLGDAALAAARGAVEKVLAAQKPYPAFALDRHWNVVAWNGALAQLFADLAPELAGPPMNAMRVSLHPGGLAPLIENLPEWRAHLLARLRRQIGVTGDPALATLLAECLGYPGGEAPEAVDANAVLVPLKLRTPAGTLALFSTTTVFGTPVEVTLAELAIELFFPADEATAEAVRRL